MQSIPGGALFSCDTTVAKPELPDTVWAQLARAVDLLRGGEYLEAEHILQEVVSACPHYAEAWAYLGACLARRGVIDRAGECLDRALDLAPQSLAVRLKRGEYFLRLGIYPLAQVELQEAIRLAGPAQRRTASYAHALLLYARQQERGGFVRDTSMARLATLCAYAALVFAVLTGALRKGIERVLTALSRPASGGEGESALPQGRR